MNNELQQPGNDGNQTDYQQTDPNYDPSFPENIDVVIEGQENPNPSENNEEFDDREQQQNFDDRDHQKRYPRKKRTSQNRIDEITYQKKLLETRVLQAEERERQTLQYAQSIEREKQQYAQLAQEKNQESLLEREKFLKSQLILAEKGIEDSKLSEDVETETKFQTLMSKFHNDLAILQEKKKLQQESNYSQQNHYQEPYQQPYQQPYQPQQQYYPPQPQQQANPYYEEWVDRNPWYGKNSKLTEDANQYADKLKDFFDYNGYDIDEGFFKKLDEEIGSKYSVNPQQQYNQQPSYNYQERNAPVAPINRQGGYNSYSSNQYPPNRTRVSLTPQQNEVVKHLKTHNLSEPQKAKAYEDALKNMARGLSPMGNPRYF